MSAVLLLDGGDTTCSVVVANEAYGLVAANCISPDDTWESGKPKKYQVAVSQIGDKHNLTFDINKITVHPAYDANTFANNIAIVYFESNGIEPFQTAVADWPQDWDGHYFVYHHLSSNSPVVFEKPIIYDVAISDSIGNDCSANSKVYALNPGDFACSTLTITWHGNSSCEAPFNMMYGKLGQQSAVAAIYSHSAIPGTKAFCGGGKVYNYYTLLQHYMSWISTTTERQVAFLHHLHNGYTPHMVPDYAIKIPANNGTIEGVEVLEGYTNELAIYGDDAEAHLQPIISMLAGLMGFGQSSTTTATSGPPDYMGGRPNFLPQETMTLMSIQTTTIVSVDTTVATSVVTAIATTILTTTSTASVTTSLTTSSTTSSPTLPITVVISTPTDTTTATATVTFSSVQTVAAQPTTVFITLPPATQSILMTTTNTVTSNGTITMSATITVSETLAGQASISPDEQSRPSTLNIEDKRTTGLIVAVALLLAILVGLLVFYVIRRRRQKAMGNGGNGISRVRRWWLFGGGANNEDSYNPSEYARSYSPESQPMSRPLAY
ncbi:hypothetical protein GGI16_002021 [Coemansia sp. S142-1]|nr:hypothetical protein GGI16_002021 [Coemansia sp. S142-1]